MQEETFQLILPLNAVKTGKGPMVTLPIGALLKLQRELSAAGFVEIAYDGDVYSVLEEDLRNRSANLGRYR